MAGNRKSRLLARRRVVQYLTLGVLAVALVYGAAGGWRSAFAVAWERVKLRGDGDGDAAAAIPAITRAVERVLSDRRAVESAVYASLYDEAPGGFTRAIDIASAFLAQPRRARDRADADLYAYLACAYGQQYRWAAAAHVPPEQLQQIRDAAVNAASAAISLDPRWKAWLRRLAAPEPGSQDDDLAALRNDEKLKQLLEL